jgi:BarA-like signal transduction histidine kinase
VLGHHDISIHAKAEAAAHALERALKDSSARVGYKERTAVITTEGYEMALPGVVITYETARHVLSVRSRTSPLKAKEALSGPPVSEWD